MATPTLFTSNRLELLARELARNLRAPLSSPFIAETIVVPNRNVARWLQLELAQAQGISANYLFPFSKHFALFTFSSAFPDRAEIPSPFEPESTVWAVFQALPRLIEQPEFGPLKNYLGHDGDSRKLFQIADRIARLFDQYLIFRPDIILEWDNGEGDGWQPILWRNVAATIGGPHPATLRKEFFDLALSPNAKFSRPAERISIFGVSALPRFYLEMFEALAAHSPINVYLLQPCAQWWGYISSDRETEKVLRRPGHDAGTAGLHLERGNRLLASLGQQGREFLNLLHDFDWTEHDHSDEPPEDSLLHCIQSDLFNLHDRGAGGDEKHVVEAKDDSIRVNNCHSPLREMEVLHDHLLDWFERDPTLTPRDILVMAPDINTYAPFIRAVFESPESDSQRIHIGIADCSARSRSTLIETFLKILALPQTRLGATTILSILEVPSVRKNFGLSESNIDLIHSWIEKTGIRWGKDATQRAALGLPEISDHSWQHGINRLLLGYALAGDEREMFNGILPFDDVEGEGALALGKLSDFLEKIFTTVEQLKSPRTLSSWSNLLRDTVEIFFDAEEEAELDLKMIRDALADLSRNEILSGFDGEVPLDVILEPLTRRLNEETSSIGFLTGGVTFCALKPGRSLPFKIICLVGMNDGVFPRADSWLSFDLTAQDPRLGDRSSREDDRYFFLETLISAREKLYISYTGQSIRDNSPSSPSVLVNQLLDYIDQGFNLEEKSLVSEHLVTKHRLQAFSHAYFSGGPLFSYSRENFSAGQSVRPDRTAPAPILIEPISDPEPEFREVSIESLADFFNHPAKFLATRRLGIYLPGLETPLQDSEPFALGFLDDYQLKQQLLEMRIAGKPLQEAAELLQASGVLPAGSPGEAAFANLRATVEKFYTTLEPHLGKVVMEPVSIELAIDDFQVSGQFKNITNAGLLSYRCAKIKSKDLIRAWIQHLAWNAADHAQPAKSILIGTDMVYEFSVVKNSREILDSLLKIYWRGLAQPIKFFPKSSFAYFEAQGSTRKSPLGAAHREWEGNSFQGIPGEGDDAYFNLFFRNTEPFDDEFISMTNEFFRPLLAHARKTES